MTGNGASSPEAAKGVDDVATHLAPRGGRTSRALFALRQVTDRLAALRASAVFGLSGAAFAVGNLLLARVMPVDEFGRLTLALALFNVFAVVAPMGLDQIVLRHSIGLGRRLLAFLLLVGAGVGVAVGMGTVLLSSFSWTDATLLALLIVTGGVIFVVGAGLRAAEREMEALLAATAASWLLLAIGLLALAAPMPKQQLPLALFAGGNLAASTIGWIMLARVRRISSMERVTVPWREAASFLGVAAIGTLMLQLERLLIPATLDVEALALFSVLASVAIFPFRMAAAGAGFALVPKLRATRDPAVRRRLVRDELLSIGVLLAVASLCVIVAAPLVARWLTGDRYQIGLSLALSACVSGSAKVLQVLPRAVLTGCGDERDIAMLNWWGWLGLAMGTAGAFVGTGWGLTGVICGFALGTLAGSIPTAMLARRRLER